MFGECVINGDREGRCISCVCEAGERVGGVKYDPAPSLSLNKSEAAEDLLLVGWLLGVSDDARSTPDGVGRADMDEPGRARTGDWIAPGRARMDGGDGGTIERSCSFPGRARGDRTAGGK